MSATARALSISEILSENLVHLPERDLWTAGRVSVAWWQAAQYAALLTREKASPVPEKQLECLMEGLCFGPRGIGRGVKHLTLSTGARNGGLHHAVRLTTRLALRACSELNSLAIYDNYSGEALVPLINLIQNTLPASNLTWLRLDGVCPSEIGRLRTALGGFPNLRHLRLDNFDLNSDPISRLIPHHLDSLVLTSTDLNGRMLGAERLDKLAHATGPALRHLGLDFSAANSAAFETGLTIAALRAIPELWPALQVLDLFLFRLNVENHLDQVFGLLEMPALCKLRLRLRLADGEQASARLETKLALALSKLAKADQKKVEIEKDVMPRRGHPPSFGVTSNAFNAGAGWNPTFANVGPLNRSALVDEDDDYWTSSDPDSDEEAG